MGKPNRPFWDCKKYGCFVERAKFDLRDLAEEGCSENRAFTDLDALTERRGNVLVIEHKLLTKGEEPRPDKDGENMELPLGQHILFCRASGVGKLVTIVVAGPTNKPKDITHAGAYFEGRWSGWVRASRADLIAVLKRWDEWAEAHPADRFKLTPTMTPVLQRVVTAQLQALADALDLLPIGGNWFRKLGEQLDVLRRELLAQWDFSGLRVVLHEVLPEKWLGS